MFTKEDIKQVEARGLTVQKVEQQLANFNNGFPYLNIVRAATVGDGIKTFSEHECQQMEHMFNSIKESLSFVKFVPASGAATRMFKDLYEYVGEGKESAGAKKVIENIKDFAFYDELIAKGADMSTPKSLLSSIIYEPLNYGSKPKALLAFHKYSDAAATALEEHLVEGALYGSSSGVAKIHFTVSPEHLEGFKELIARVIDKYEKRYNIKYEITYSEQKSSTDTIAVDMDNNPFREKDNALLFRPAGHGALIENLNDLSGDIIFIKTVDNVASQKLIDTTVRYKKMAAALLIIVQRRIFAYAKQLDTSCNASLIREIVSFVEKELSYKFSANFFDNSLKDQVSIVKNVINRPMRICGMVRNEGEPGGGPFWVQSEDGALSLQIAEAAQISPDNISLMKNSTHFNPVDIICSTMNHKHEKYDLSKFTDPKTGFISKKSKDGKDLKAQELPGLWNGAMASWNTIFIEVPIETFNPVKVVSDFLRVQHQ